MVSRNERKKTFAIAEEYWKFIERKSRKGETHEDCLRRLTKFKPRRKKK